uniref:Cellulase n=1 Tax=Chrysomela tremula TaxID=63687 RepID=E7CIS3_CHRTR|nr:endo-beta-1,4-glucanase [Chrysomela tremula]
MKLSVVILTTYLSLGYSASEPSPTIIPRQGGLSGTGITTRYWDCCKPSCSWADHVTYTKNATPVTSCSVDGVTEIDAGIQSGCAEDGSGSSYTCSNQQPFIVNSTLAYGFAAASFIGGEDYGWCCSCMLLSFQGQLAGKQMLVQVTNTGSPLSTNQFDIEIPGGGVGLYPYGCATQWGADPESGWGERYGGVSSAEECSQLPESLQAGCLWRFDFMEGVSNPNVTFYQVECPSELVAITGCDY